MAHTKELLATVNKNDPNERELAVRALPLISQVYLEAHVRIMSGADDGTILPLNENDDDDDDDEVAPPATAE